MLLEKSCKLTAEKLEKSCNIASKRLEKSCNNYAKTQDNQQVRSVEENHREQSTAHKGCTPSRKDHSSASICEGKLRKECNLLEMSVG